MGSVRKREDRPSPWEARWRDPEGKQRRQSFGRKVDATRFLATVEADMLRRTYVDPDAGTVTLRDLSTQWLARQVFEETTRETTESRLRVHILPHLGDLEVRAIKPSVVQAWVRGRQDACSARYVRTMLANLSSILSSAVEDGIIPANPVASASVRAPSITKERVVPWTTQQVSDVINGHPEPYRAVPVVAAGCGLRQGEVFGLAVDAVDFLGRTLHIRQQVRIERSRLTLAPPKYRKIREVPLPDIVAQALSERIRRFPPGEDGLIFTSRESKPLNRNYYNGATWKPALVQAGIEPTRSNGMHALRHHYASVLLHDGVSIRALADFLGHADPGFTLRTYAHMMPESVGRARQAVDSAFSSISRCPGVAQEGS